MDALATGSARARAEPALAAPAIELEHVTLVRGGRTILSDVSAAIRPGEFIGMFGPNGSGKTTLLHAILGLLRPASGSVRVLGETPSRGNPAAGYLPQRRAAAGDLGLRGWDFVACAWHGERWGLPWMNRAAREQVDWAIATVEGEALARRPVRELSGGQVQRLLLAQALLGQPKLLLLDEPLISLDPRFQQAVVALVKRIQQREGTTVIFTAHELNPLLGAMDRVLYLGACCAELGTVEQVVTSQVLSKLYETPVEVLHVHDRILVVTGQGMVSAEGHRHDA